MVLKVLAAAFLAFALVGCTDAPPAATSRSSGPVDDAAIESLARDFEQVAFHTDDALKAAIEPHRLTRAGIPARFNVTVEDFMSAAQKNASMAMAKSATDVIRSGAGIDVGLTRSQSGFAIINTDKRYYGELRAVLTENVDPGIGPGFDASMARSGCAIVIATNTPYRNELGLIVSDVSKPEALQKGCVYRGIAAVLGLTGTTEGSTAAFGKGRPPTGFSERDLAMFRMLYDPRLKPGMTLAEARPLLPEIAADALAR